MQLPSLLLDPVFKHFFTSDLHALSSLISAFPYPDGSNRIEVLEIISSEIIPRYPDLKRTFLDLKARDKKGSIYQIELQVAKDFSYKKRSLYYASGLVQNQLKPGNGYLDLVPVIQINILDFVLFERDSIISRFVLKEKDHPDWTLTEDLQILFVELPKSKTKSLDQVSDDVSLWLFLLKQIQTLSEEEIMSLLKKKPDLKNAFNVLELYSSDPEKRREMEERIRSDRNFAYEVAGWFEEGLEEGLEKGKFENALETARRMKEEGLTIELIERMTGLTRSDLEENGLM